MRRHLQECYVTPQHEDACIHFGDYVMLQSAQTQGCPRACVLCLMTLFHSLSYLLSASMWHWGGDGDVMIVAAMVPIQYVEDHIKCSEECHPPSEGALVGADVEPHGTGDDLKVTRDRVCFGNSPFISR